MTEQTMDDAIGRNYCVISIEKADPPEGIEGSDWYEYVIGPGSSPISGKRSGTLKSVTEYVEDFVANLNQRSAMGYSPNTARKTGAVKKAPAELSGKTKTTE